MTDTATPSSPPQWLRQIIAEIDSLTFGPGFAHMDADTEMFFGIAHLVGAEAIKAFFIRIDEPLYIRHDVVECWKAEGVYIIRGQATMAKKAAPETVVKAPFMHIYYLDGCQPPRIRTIRITAGPLQTDSVL
ncbi:MAG: hypothetical protein WB785_17915 [Mycobacterium sp.]|uniref:hypothetical protein n=1 Tax=Mycobacterium sp. TaxID=1785 RepID=UPI003C514B79